MITKEQWEDIEKELSGIYGHVEFKLDDKKLYIAKQLVSENKLSLMVYIDGSINAIWGFPNEEKFLPLTEKVWHKKTRSLYTPTRKASIIKTWGKRAAKKDFPDLDKKMVYYNCYFEKFSVLKRQFSKIKELELIKSEV